MRNLVRTLILVIGFSMISFVGKSQYGPLGYGYGIRFGCGNDLDLTFTGSMLLIGGGLTYGYGTQVYPYMYTQPPTQLQINKLQTIGVTLVITGAVVLIEESIRHSLHRRR
jgi:hypothetical protein